MPYTESNDDRGIRPRAHAAAPAAAANGGGASCHWHILRSYISRWQFWLCVWIWGSQFFAFAVTGSHSSSIEILPFALGFGVLYVCAGIGIQVKEQLGSYRSSLIPGFRRPHLLWAGIWIGLVILPFVVVAALKSLNALAVLGLGLLFSACAFAALCRGGWNAGMLALLFLGTFAEPMVDVRLWAFLVEAPWLSSGMTGIGAIWLARTFHFLATMNEDSPGYASQVRGSSRSLRGPLARRREAEAIERMEKSKSIWLHFVDWSLPDSRVYVGNSRRRRMMQWMRADANRWWTVILIPCVAWSLMAAMQFFSTRGQPDFGGIVTRTLWVPILMPQIVFISTWQARVRVLGRELTYPVRRRDLLSEQGIAVLACQYIGWGLLMLEILAITTLLPVARHPGQLLPLLLISGSWQLVATGVSARVASTQTAVPLILTVLVNTTVGTGILALCIHFRTPLVSIVISIGLTLIGVLALYAAYTYWLTADVT